MNVTTTTNILFERNKVPTGTQLDVSDEQGRSLIAQGVAEAVKTAKQQPETAPEATKHPETTPNLDKMNRAQLDEVAGRLGMDKLEQYDTKAKLIAAIKEAQNG